MLSIDPLTAVGLMAGGLVAGIVNTLAGGGSLLTVPLLVVLGMPGTVANATNRVGVLLQSWIAAWQFRAEGVSGFRSAKGAVAPALLGSLVGAVIASRLSDALFERLFGVLMLVMLLPTLRRPRRGAPAAPARRWSGPASLLAFFGIGFYAGAFQAGVGIILLLGLSHAGFDLVRGNAVKMVIIAVLTLAALPVFVLQGQVEWLPAGLLAVGFAAGGALGARIAVRGGEALIRPVLVAAVLALAGRMFGLY